MNKCVCCGVSISPAAKMCRECYDIAVNNPCRSCTAETGRTIGCQGSCDKHHKWRKGYDALTQLRKTLRRDDYWYRIKNRRNYNG